MPVWKNGRMKAVIVLHEIYGINDFIRGVCAQYAKEGYDVYCPDFQGGMVYPYAAARQAYDAFMAGRGIEGACERIHRLAKRLSEEYPFLLLAGFSVGATAAWRCSENPAISGVVCCYGSRIRDALEIHPNCPALLVFAGMDSFDVPALCASLKTKANIELYTMDANHGFLDPYGPYSCHEGQREFETLRAAFLRRITPEECSG